MNEPRIPCLGRPFRLGSLYDCRTDTLLPETLWDDNVIEMALQNSGEHFEPKINTIIADSKGDKMNYLKFSSNLKLNLLSGFLVDVSGPVMNFLDKMPPPSSNQARVYVTCQTISKMEEVDTDKTKTDDRQKDVLKQATHVVVKIQHGTESFYAIDCPIKSGQSQEDVQSSMKDVITTRVSQHSKSLDSNSISAGEEDYKCSHYYSDMTPHKPLNTLPDVLEASRHQQYNLVDKNNQAVPKWGWLCPLSQFITDNESTQPGIAVVGEEVVTSILTMFERMNEIQIRASDLITEYQSSLSKLSTLHRHLVKFKDLVLSFIQRMKQNLCSYLSKVHNGEIEEDLLTEIKETAFDPDCLSKWLCQTKTEIQKLSKKILNMLPDSVEFVTDIPNPQGSVQNVLCFACNVSEEEDQLLKAMSDNLTTSELAHGNWLKESWADNEQVVEAFSESFQKFSTYSELNKDLRNLKFVVVESNLELSTNHAAIILLTKPDSKQLIELPSKPGTPEVDQAGTTTDCISLQWTEPKNCEGSQTIESYIVFYCPRDSVPDQEQNLNWKRHTALAASIKIPMDHFVNKRKYVFKVSPVLHQFDATCIESESILIDIGSIQSAQESICRPGKPKASKVTHNSIHLQWDKPKYGSEHVSVYIILYRSLDETDNVWEQKPCKALQSIISGLKQEKKYLFKVRVISKSSEILEEESEISDPIETRLTCQPGKPKLVLATHNTIQLEWSKPEYGGNSVEFYIVVHRKLNKTEWSGDLQYTEEPKEKITFEGLQLGVHYVFAVKPVCRTNCRYAAIESEISEPIKTVPICKTGKPMASAVTHDSITVMWEKPDYGEENVEFYMLSYRAAGDTQWKRENAQKEMCKKVIDLKVNTKYLFQVRPECDGTIQGIESEISDEIETKLTCQPGKPFDVLVTNNTITLKWDQPEHYSDSVELYIVSHCSKHELHWKHKTTTNETIEISGLTTGTEYMFKVKPECKENQYPVAESDVTLIKTKLTSKPGQPLACNVRYNKFDAVWDHPEHGKENVKYYKVMNQLLDDLSTDPEWITTETKNVIETVSIKGLISNHKYHFKVIPVCQNNENGMESDMSIPINTPPACQPSIPIATNITHNSISLTWEKPSYRNDQIKHYTVRCHSHCHTKLTSGGLDQKILSTKSEETQIKFNDLNIDTEYVFIVVPECHASEVVGVESDESERIRTKAASSPEKVKAKAVDHKSIKVTWSTPTIITKNFSLYCVSYKATQSDEWKISEKVPRGTGRTCIVRKLTASTQYTFKVCAQTENGLQGTESKAITTETKPSCKPGKIYCNSVSHDTIEIEWVKPKDFFSSVENYIVSYHAQDSVMSVIDTKCTNCYITVPNLKLNTGYVFNVKPVCSSRFLSGRTAVESTDSDVIFTKATSKPGRPTAVASSVTHNSIRLQWMEPEYGAHNIKSYTVFYHKSSEVTDAWLKTETDRRQTSMTISELPLNSLYTFKVRPISTTGIDGTESDVSGPIQTKATSPPTNLAVTEKTHNSIKLLWSRPEYLDKDITQLQYLVLYSKVSDLQTKPSSIATKEEFVEVKGLLQKTMYTFKVIPECGNDFLSLESSESEQFGPVETKPSCKTSIPVASKITHDSVELNWNKPDFASDSVDYYNISYWPADDPENIISVQKTDGKTEIETIQDLFFNTAYIFRIRPNCANPEIGTECSYSNEIKTKATSNPGKPQASKLFITHNSVELNWKRPEFGSELIKSYTVSYCKLKDLEDHCQNLWNTKETDGLQENIYIGGLNLKEEYVFKILSICMDEHCEGSESDHSDPVITRATSPPGIPNASNVSNDSIQLEWSPPECGAGNVAAYTVFYRSRKDEEWKKQTSNRESLKILGLEMNTRYMFKVKSECNSGLTGSEGISSEYTTRSTSKPGRPNAISSTYDSIKLKWTKPNKGYENIKFYKVFYHQMESYTTSNLDDTVWEEHETNDTHLYAEIIGLNLNTQYVFKVQPVCLSGDGLDSDYSELCSTKATSPPGIPEASYVTHDTIELKWCKPVYGSKNVDHYIISYQDESGTPEEWKTRELKTRGSDEFMTVTKLNLGSSYKFTVTSVCAGPLTGMESKPCLPINTKFTSPPGNLKAVDAKQITCNTITLSWTKPQIGSEHITHYYIYYCATALQDKWLGPIQTPDDKNVFTVSKLTTQTQYKFRVEPVCKTGKGSESKCSDVIATKPSSKPGRPKLTSVAHDSVYLEWQKPRYGSEEVEYYTVLCQKIMLNQNQLEKEQKGSKKCSIHIHDLFPCTKYVFIVRPEFKSKILNLAECSEPSDPIVTKATSPPSKPTAGKVTHNSVQLRWNEPTYGKNFITKYCIMYQLVRGSEYLPIQKVDFVRKNETEVLDLNPGEKYVFKVCAICDEGEGSESETSEVIETKATSPPEIIEPVSESVTHNSIKLNWTKPEIGRNIKVELYSVWYQQSADKQWTQKCTGNVQESILLEDLNLNTRYNINVQPKCKSGIGSNSKTVTITTKSTSPPGQPTALLVLHNEIHLKWTKPTLGAQNMSGYTIFFCQATEKTKEWIDLKYIVKPSDESTIIPNLNPGTSYIFKLLTQTKSGTGTESDPSDPIETKVTSKPGTPEAYEISHISLSLRWTKPIYVSSLVKEYVVLYKEATLVTDWEERVCKINDMVIGGLNPGKQYIFKILPKCESGEGTLSDVSKPLETRSTSPPGKPKESMFEGSITHDSITLTWTAPTHGTNNVTGYILHYKIRDHDHDSWKKCVVNSAAAIVSQTVKKLKSNTKYIFKVSSTCPKGIGAESECSEPIETKPSCKPGKPEAVNITHESMSLKWGEPEYGKVISYTVICKKLGTNQMIQETTNEISIKLEGLEHKTEYEIEVNPQIIPESGIITENSETATIKTKHIPLAERMKKNSKLLKSGNKCCPAIYQVPIQVVKEDDQNKIKECFVGEDEVKQNVTINYSRGKVMLIVGATGTGKSTLINGLVNYFFGVKWEHSYRFKLIVEESQSDQTKSQTKWITAYTIQQMEECPIDYPLTIIDTPGFGDTEGIERDQRLVEQIRAFFCTEGDGRIEQLNVIGFATQSGLARLTHLQKYIFHSVLSVFGKDVKNNICMMITFADGATPPVLKAVSTAGVPYYKHFLFNNSALFNENGAKNNGGKMFWNMGAASFEQFFEELGKITPISLLLTKEVLEEREHLEVCIEGLQQQVRVGLTKIDALHQEEDILKKHEAQLCENKTFTYTVKVIKQRKTDLNTGEYVTNCLTCNFTCHYPCYIPKDENKYYCAAMGNERNTTKAECSECPQKCHWSKHVNNPYKFEIYEENEVKTSDDLKKRYYDAKGGKLKVEHMIIKLHKDLEEWYKEVLETIYRTHQILKRLGEIALKPNHLTEVGYIELLIESEKQEAELGFQERIRSLEKIKEKAILCEKIPLEKFFDSGSSKFAKVKPWEKLISTLKSEQK